MSTRVRSLCEAVLFCAVSLTACGRPPPPSRFPDADALLARMRATHACSRGVSGEAKLDYYGQEGRVRGNLLYLVSAPDRVRLDVFSPFGATISTVTSDGRDFALYDLKQKSFLRGPANACNLQRFTRVPLPPHAFAELLRGEAPVLVHDAPSARLEWEASSYVVRIRSKHQAEQEIRLVPAEADWNRAYQEQRVRVLSVAVSQAGVPLYSVELDGHEPAPMSEPRRDPDGIDPPIPPSGPECRAEVPRRIRFLVGDGERDLLLVSKEVQHNPPIVPGVFSQEPPPAVRVGYSRCDQ
ncbi:MAG: LolA family protein [Myxococcota bacterium]